MPTTIAVEGEHQYRAFANPVRRQILEACVDYPRTAKSIAEELQVAPTSLYRHLDILLNSGLLVVEREVPKRGVTERWFRSVVREEAHPELASAPGRLGVGKLYIRLRKGAEQELLHILAEAAKRFDDHDGEHTVVTVLIDPTSDLS